jgi:Ca-activated chloride channel homolog
MRKKVYSGVLVLVLSLLWAGGPGYAQAPATPPPQDQPQAAPQQPQQPQQAPPARPGLSQRPPQTLPEQREDPGVPKFSVESRLVVLHATVLNKDHHVVTDLQRDHFKVYEDNIEQRIKDFKREDIPVSVGILIDNSGSMRDKRGKVNSAALTLVRNSNPRDEVFVVNFNDEAFLDKDFTSNLEELKEGLEKIDSRGGTAYYDAIQMSLDHLRERGRLSKKALVVVTDGEDNASRMTLEALLKLAQESEAAIYTVGLLSDENNRAAKRARKAMQAISESTGGAAFFPEHVNEIEAIAARIAHDMRNQYVLTYTPTNPIDNGGFRSVKVAANAPGKGKLFVRTRTGYYASTGQQAGGAPRSDN